MHAKLRGCVTVLDARTLHGLDFTRPPPPAHDYFLDNLVAQEDAKQQQRVISAERMREPSSSPHLPAREMSSSPHLPEVRAVPPLGARKVSASVNNTSHTHAASVYAHTRRAHMCRHTHNTHTHTHTHTMRRIRGEEKKRRGGEDDSRHGACHKCD